ncbi:MAG: hypothetical protein CVU38_02435 [Chloroflexi bacterium HGW-Chloroflexi-1]|nr:MAG: hypothetical protein CVU38_02435 [Chloroflexi bacterium HGW-Chloroflexi-1]
MINCSKLTGSDTGQLANAHRPLSSCTAIRVALFLIALVALTACEASPNMKKPETQTFDPMRFLTQQFDRKAVEQCIGQPMPASATEIHTMGEAALDTMVIARFNLPSSDLAAYLAALGVTEPLAPGDTPFLSTEAPFADATDWWQVPDAKFR